PESPFTPSPALGCDEPGSKKGDGHGGPLQSADQVVHGGYDAPGRWRVLPCRHANQARDYDSGLWELHLRGRRGISDSGVSTETRSPCSCPCLITSTAG